MQEPASLGRQTANNADHDDRTLVRLAQGGDEGAIRFILTRHNRRLYRIARAVMRDDFEAEDIVQESYLRAFASLHTYRGDASLGTWLSRIALNEALGRLRRRRSAASLSNAMTDENRNQTSIIMFRPASAISDPEADLARRQVRDLLEKAVDELPELFRVVFVLRMIEEMSTEETAVSLGISAATVKTRLHRAHRMIRGMLDRRLSSAFSALFPFGGTRCDRMTARVLALLCRNGGLDRKAPASD